MQTYRDVTLYPGPRLNLVLGPNGSGKSSIVCGVGLALCASNKRLGRADHVKEFVRKGSDRGSVELTISGGGGGNQDWVIERHLHAADNTSTFKINGEAKAKRDVEKLNQELNIQLDNLCQFLPQEKVQEFSRMTPEELLVSTERAIGDAELERMHNTLVQGGRQMQELQTKCGNTERQLNRMQQERDTMQRDVRKIEEQEALQLGALKHRTRALQLRAEAADAALVAAKKVHNKVRREMQKLQDDEQSKEAPIVAKEAEKRAVTHQINEKKREIKVLEGNVRQQQLQLLDEVLPTKWADAQAALKDADSKEAARQQRLSSVRQLLDTSVTDLENFPAQPMDFDPTEEERVRADRLQVTEQLNTIADQRSQLRQQKVDAERDLEAAKQQLARMQQVSHQRLQALDQHKRGIREFKLKVDEMKRQQLFRGNVYGPIATEIKMVNQNDNLAADALEMQIPARLMPAFVTEFREDQDLIKRTADDMKKDRIVAVINYAASTVGPLEHRLGAAASMSHLGVVAALDQVFDAPLVVKHVLADQCGINTAYLVNTDDKCDIVFDKTAIRTLYSPQNRNAKILSRYNKDGVSYTTTERRPAKLLRMNVDEEGIRTQQAKIDKATAIINELRPQLAALDEEEQRVKEQGAALDADLKRLMGARAAHRNNKKRLEAKIEKLKLAITKAEKESPLLQKPKLEKELAAMRAEAQAATAAVVAYAQDKFEKLTEIAALHAHLGRLTDEIQALRQELVEGRQRRAELEQSVRETAAAEGAAQRAAGTARAAEREQMAKLGAGEQRTVRDIAGSAEDCEAEAEALDERAAAIAVGDRGMVERYTALQRDIAAQERDLAEKHAQVQALKDDLDRSKQRWLPELKAKVETISQRFAVNFKRIGSVGEVRLREDGENYERYAIEIRVKFRDVGDLETLSASRHSGGEKSVSTIMYLLSLQNITTTPFRVVDEINQGMDQTNERKVFQAMVDAATERGTAQCLLMTPKLLPQLSYSEHVNVLSVMNGVHIGGAARNFDSSRQVAALLGKHASQRAC